VQAIHAVALRLVQVPHVRILRGTALALAIPTSPIAASAAAAAATAATTAVPPLRGQRAQRRWGHLLQSRMRPEPYAVRRDRRRVPWSAQRRRHDQAELLPVFHRPGKRALLCHTKRAVRHATSPATPIHTAAAATATAHARHAAVGGSERMH
jgi:hypothetical protein